MSDGFICFLPRSVQRSLWFPISRSSPFSHILPAAPSSCVEKGEANAWSRLQVASFFSSQIPERQWQKRSSSSAGPRSLAILAEHVGFQIMFIPSIAIALFRKTWFLGEFIKKVTESWYISHFLVISQIINIGLTLTWVISDFKELSVTLSISKI